MQTSKEIAKEYWSLPQSQKSFIGFIKKLRSETMLEAVKTIENSASYEDAAEKIVRKSDELKNL